MFAHVHPGSACPYIHLLTACPCAHTHTLGCTHAHLDAHTPACSMLVNIRMHMSAHWYTGASTHANTPRDHSLWVTLSWEAGGQCMGQSEVIQVHLRQGCHPTDLCHIFLSRASHINNNGDNSFNITPATWVKFLAQLTALLLSTEPGTSWLANQCSNH